MAFAVSFLLLRASYIFYSLLFRRLPFYGSFGKMAYCTKRFSPPALSLFKIETSEKNVSHRNDENNSYLESVNEIAATGLAVVARLREGVAFVDHELVAGRVESRQIGVGRRARGCASVR